MCKLLGKLGANYRAVTHTAALFFLLPAALFITQPVTADAQIWVTSGFGLTPAAPLSIPPNITFTPGSPTETAFCSTAAINPATGQASPAAADYDLFAASCKVTSSTGAVITSAQCPPGEYPVSYPFGSSANGNPTGYCSVDFQPQPDVTYTINSNHYLTFNVDPLGTACGQWGPTVCYSDPLGYYSFNPSSVNIWPPAPTYVGVTSYVSLLAVNSVNETCAARGGTCAPQNIPSEYCVQSIFGSICINSIGAPRLWYLAQTSEPWQVRCSDVVQGSVTPVANDSPSIIATFTPNFGFTIAQAAQVCGFINFDWQQLVTVQPAPSPFFAVGSKVPLTAPPGFLDPPPGGYDYELTAGYPTGDNAYPFYYNPNPNPGQPGPAELAAHEPRGIDGTILNFKDTPTDPCLFGGDSAGVPGCNGSNAQRGQTVQFITHLAGINPDGTAHDLGIGFNWNSSNNGTSGGTATTKNSLPMDPGSGTGGATITSVSETTSFQYPTAPGVPASTLTYLSGTQVSATISNLVGNGANRTIDETMTITNVGSGTIAGPFQMVLDSQRSACGELENATGTFGGWPYITVPGAESIDPGQSVSVDLQFTIGPCIPTIFTPLIYSGSFD